MKQINLLSCCKPAHSKPLGFSRRLIASISVSALLLVAVTLTSMMRLQSIDRKIAEATKRVQSTEGMDGVGHLYQQEELGAERVDKELYRAVAINRMIMAIAESIPQESALFDLSITFPNTGFKQYRLPEGTDIQKAQLHGAATIKMEGWAEQSRDVANIVNALSKYENFDNIRVNSSNASAGGISSHREFVITAQSLALESTLSR